jgi:hypothetical protein
MGILESLGYKGPFAQFIGAHRNAIGGLGAGIARGRNFGEGIAYGTEGALQGRQADDIFAATKKKEADDALALERAIENMRKYSPEIADIVASGGMEPDAAWNSILTSSVSPLQGDEQPGGTYAGTGMDAQNWNILLKATQDPSFIGSPEYAAAYSQLTQPRVTYQQTANGVVPVMETPQIPAWVQPPPGMGPSPGGATMGQPEMPGAAPMPGQPPVATGQPGLGVGAPLPGTLPKPTEAQNRLGMMSDTITNEVRTFHENVAAMDDMGQQLIAMGGPLANPWLSEDYQQAAQSIATSASQVLYALSGAAAGDAETEKRIKEVTPVFGDKPGTIRDKINRFNNYVMTLANASGDPEKIAAAQAALEAAQTPHATPTVEELLQKYP